MKIRKIMFLHGLEGSSRGVKAQMLRKLFPFILIPDFSGTLAQRMEQLTAILSGGQSWILIGSSFGGLMAALYSDQYPQQVEKMILLAPALVWPEFSQIQSRSISVPTVIFHGGEDQVLPIDFVRDVAEKVFTNLDFRAVIDDHGLHETAKILNWSELIIE